MGGDIVVVIIVIIYMVGMLAIGKLAERKTKGSADEYLVAGRNMPLWMVTATLFATWWGAETVMGSSGTAFHEGIMSTLYDPWAGGAALILAGFFYMKVCRDMKLRSMGSFYKHRFGNLTALVASYAMVPGYVLWLACQILAIAKIFHAVLGWPIMSTSVIAAAVVIYYTYTGGILADVWTDFIQMFLILLGLALLIPIAIHAAGGWDVVNSSNNCTSTVVTAGGCAAGGWYEMHSSKPDDFWRFFPDMGDLDKWIWWVAVFVCYSLGNIPGPDLMQRSFIAKDSRTAMRCGIIAGCMYWVLGLLPITAVLCFKALMRQDLIPLEITASVVKDSELLIPMLAQVIMHPWMVGIFIAALLSAIMSSGDSSLFASAAIIANDITPHYYAKKYGKAMEDGKIYLAGRWAVLGTGAAALLITLASDSLYQLLIFSVAYIWHMLFFPFTLGIYWKKCNAYGAISGMAVGLVVLLIACVTQYTAEPEPEWLWCLLPASLSGVAVVVVSLLTQKKNPPLPLTSEQDEIIKWPELAGNLPAKS